MKEFTTAVEDSLAEDEREKAIVARTKELVEKYPDMPEEEAREQAAMENEPYIEFTLDGRVMRAYMPTEGQLTFMLAALGRGQTQDSRFSSIINIMMESLREGDRDYFESRLLTRDPKRRLPVKQVEQIFEFLVGEWFGNPTQEPSISVTSQPSDGPRSTPPTTPSLEG